jgi:hypothetical protein
MTREDAERTRDRLAGERPESTWILHDVGAGAWEIVRIGMKPSTPASGTTSEAKPRPPMADDPRSAQAQLFPPSGA